MAEAALPCSVKLKLLLPTVKLPLGVIVFSTVVDVISELAPEAAAPRFERAPDMVLALVPPLATLNCPVVWISPAAVILMKPEAVRGKVADAPLKSGIVIVLLTVCVAGSNETVCGVAAPSLRIMRPLLPIDPIEIPAEAVPDSDKVLKATSLVEAILCGKLNVIGLAPLAKFTFT